MCRIVACLVALSGFGYLSWAQAPQQEFRRLPVSVYRDKMKAGWIGQMVGVSWGAPTEFKWTGKIIPADKMPPWKDNLVNGAFGQDDLYVEMTFLRTLEQYGLDASTRQAGIDFANSEYALWCANRAGRQNLRKGIAPPDSGHPKFSRRSDDIDYQIEADFSGLVAPGLPNAAIALGEKFGRLMNYGDGLYGGQFIGGMYAEAFFESDLARITEAGLRCIPAGSQYAEMVRDMLQWHRQDPGDWERTWDLVNRKYLLNPEYRKYSSGGKGAWCIDAKLNGAYILMGLLYGRGDPDQTIIIATRCGQDSDCNPSNAAGVLFTTIGFADLPDRFKAKLNEENVFSHTAYNFPRLLAACEKVAREAVATAGGRIERDAKGEEIFVIPAGPPKPPPLEQSWEAGPIAEARFTPEEMAQITQPDEATRALKAVAPGWTLTNCGEDMGAPGLLDEFRGKKSILITHPLDRETGCSLSKRVAIPAGKTTTLALTVGHHPQGDWLLVVKANGATVLSKPIGPDTATEGWLDVQVDLSDHAAKEIDLELVNQPTDWAWEAAYWARIALEGL